MSAVSTYFLLDGSSLAFRAYFALPEEMAAPSGEHTNAVFGFSSMLANLLRDHRPDGLAVAMDLPGPTFRDYIVADYKAGRPSTPDSLIDQIELIEEMCRVLNIKVMKAPGYEADDVLATLATMARDAGQDAVVVTGDRDCFQLAEDPHVRVLYNRRGVSDYVLYDEAGIKERTGISPAQYPDYAAMRGDPSDNLIGIPGVGEKRAAELLNKYGTLEAILGHVSELTPKLREAFVEHADRARKNAQVIPLRRDLDLGVSLDDLRFGPWDKHAADSFFERLGIHGPWARLSEALGFPTQEASVGSGASSKGLDPGAVAEHSSFSGPDLSGTRAPSDQAPLPAQDLSPAAPDHAELVCATSEASAARHIGSLQTGHVLIDGGWNGMPGRSPLVFFAVAPLVGTDQGLQTETHQPGLIERVEQATGVYPETDGGPRSSGIQLSGDLLESEVVLRALKVLLEERTPKASAYRAKELAVSLQALRIDMRCLDMDVAVAAYLLDPDQGGASLETLGRRLGARQEIQNGLELSLAGGQENRASTSRRLAVLGRLVPTLRRELAEGGVMNLYEEIERPLVRVLARMETAGIRVDTERLSQLSKDLTDQASRLEREIWRHAGEELNVNSTPQLRILLFDKLGLKPKRRTKTGFSTDAATLEQLRDEHPVVEALIRYREVEKLRSTYCESLLAEVQPDGRIHASFNQTVARTGRLSSDHPNLHNIPVRTEEGRRFREVFVPKPGWWMCVADYDQIELRIIAHLSGDQGLLSAFAAGVDVHRQIAAQVFHVPSSGVSLAQRERAKAVSYGLAYGMEAYGLSRRLGMTVDEATSVLDAYFTAFPQVKSYMENVVAEARSRGYTETALGRRRPLPDLRSRNAHLRQAAERQAMNAAVQGLAADIFKLALVRLDSALESSKLSSRIVLQVHDEVLVEVEPSEREAVGNLVEVVMKDAYPLSAPLAVHVSWGRSWAEAKK